MDVGMQERICRQDSFEERIRQSELKSFRSGCGLPGCIAQEQHVHDMAAIDAVVVERIDDASSIELRTALSPLATVKPMAASWSATVDVTSKP